MMYWITGGGILLALFIFGYCVISTNGARMEEDMRDRGNMPGK